MLQFRCCHPAWDVIHVLLVFYFLAFNRLATVYFTVYDLYPTPIDGLLYLRADFTVSTAGTGPFFYRYNTMVAFASFGLFAFVVLPPSLLLLYLRLNQRELRDNTMRPYRFLYMGYSLGPDVHGAPLEDEGVCLCVCVFVRLCVCVPCHRFDLRAKDVACS